MKPRWHFLEYALAKAAFRTVEALPDRGCLMLADTLGRAVYSLSGRNRRIARENIRLAGIAESEPDIRRLARRSFQSFARMLVETTRLCDRITASNWREFVTVNMSPAVEELLRTPGQGILVASAHLGNWEVAARAISMVKPVSIIHRPFRNPRADRDFTSRRGGDRLHLISKFDCGSRRLLEVLSRGEILALMIDQRMPSDAARTPVVFFGRPAWATRSVAMLHLIARVPLVVASAVRTGPFKFQLNIVGPIACPRTGDRDEDVRVITQHATDVVEQQIRLTPEQYLWAQRRWPEGN